MLPFVVRGVDLDQRQPFTPPDYSAGTGRPTAV
jgi:hypothetical protein